MGVIVPSSEGPETPFTFAHDLVRQTLLAGFSGPRLQQLHAAVADAIAKLYPNAVKERASEIANHLLKAGSFADEQQLVRNLTLAGNSAVVAAAFEEARSSFRTGTEGSPETRIAAGRSETCDQSRWCSIDSQFPLLSTPGGR